MSTVCSYNKIILKIEHFSVGNSRYIGNNLFKIEITSLLIEGDEHPLPGTQHNSVHSQTGSEREGTLK